MEKFTIEPFANLRFIENDIVKYDDEGTELIFMKVESYREISYELLESLLSRRNIYPLIVSSCVLHYGQGIYTVEPFINNDAELEIQVNRRILPSDFMEGHIKNVTKFPLYINDTNFSFNVVESFLLRSKESLTNELIVVKGKCDLCNISAEKYVDEKVQEIYEDFQFRSKWIPTDFTCSNILPISIKITEKGVSIEFEVIFIPDRIQCCNEAGIFSITFCNMIATFKCDKDGNDKHVHCELPLLISHSEPFAVKNSILRNNETNSFRFASLALQMLYTDFGCSFFGNLAKYVPRFIPIISGNVSPKLVDSDSADKLILSFDFQLVTLIESNLIRWVIDKLASNDNCFISKDLIFKRENPKDNLFRIYRSCRRIGIKKKNIKLGFIVKTPEQISTAFMDNSFLEAICGDYDGDTVSLKSVFSVEANLVNKIITKYFRKGDPIGIDLVNEGCRLILENKDEFINMKKYPAFDIVLEDK